MSKLQVAGQTASDRLMQQMAHQSRRLDGDLPDAYQVAIVLHALADHTAIMEMFKYRPDDTSPWPEATSVGRWFHDLADEFEEIGS